MIKFYTTKDEWGFLTNFYRSKQIVDGVEYMTNEHYYQAQKCIDPEIKAWIINAPTPWSAMKAGRSLRDKSMDPNWDKKKKYIMMKGLMAKFTQSKEMKEKLLATGKEDIHEDSLTDMVWGIKGQDLLGKLLMQVRDKIRTANELGEGLSMEQAEELLADGEKIEIEPDGKIKIKEKVEISTLSDILKDEEISKLKQKLEDIKEIVKEKKEYETKTN